MDVAFDRLEESLAELRKAYSEYFDALAEGEYYPERFMEGYAPKGAILCFRDDQYYPLYLCPRGQACS